jgi:hypothetical protein
MKKIVMLLLFGTALSSGAAIAQVAEGDLILVRSSEKSPDAVADAMKTYAEGKKWIFLGANKVKPPQGEITFVKVCVPEVSKLILPLGLKYSAMLPCGNFGIYQNNGKTEISMLHPQYMYLLIHREEIEKASSIAAPLLTEMLDNVAK